MIPAALRRRWPQVHLLLLAAVLGGLLVALAEAASVPAGGSDALRLLAGGGLLLALASGARRPRGCRRFVLAGILLTAVLGLAMAVLVPPGLAGRGGGLVLALLLLAWPVARLGAHVADRLEQAGPGGWSSLLLGLPLGAAAVEATGLGPAGWLGLAAIFGLLAAAALQPRVPGTQTPGRPSPAPILHQAALAAAGAATAALLLFLLPSLALFDASTAAQDARRLVAVAVLLVLGAWTVGAAVAGGRLAWPAAALLACALAWAQGRAGDVLGELALPGPYQGLVHHPRLLAVLGPLGQDGPLAEADPWHAPVVLAWVAAPSLLLLGALLRALAGAAGAASRPGRRLAALLLGAGAACLLLALLGPRVGQWRLAVAVLATLAAGLLAILAGPLPLALRGLVAAGVVALALMTGLPRDPTTGLPFRDWFEYAEAGQEEPGGPARAWGALSVARVLERNASVLQGDHLVADGRNRVDVLPPEESGRRLEVLFPLVLTAGRDRALLAGGLHAGAIRELRAAGVREIHLAVDPPALYELARAWHPDWEDVEADGVTSSIAGAPGLFDLVLVREPAPWDTRRAALERSRLRAAAARLAPGGVLAVVLDLERCLPETPGAVARVLRGMLPAVDLWVVPDGLRTPRLLLTARERGDWPREVPALLQAALAAQGLPLEDPTDLRLLRAAADEVLERLPAEGLAGPLAPHLPRLGAVAPRPDDRVRAMVRGGEVLQVVEETAGALAAETLLPFLRRHLQGQVLAMEDTLFTPEWKRIDLDDGALDALLAVTRARPGSRILRQLWRTAATWLRRQRRVETIQRLLPGLMEELGWRPPELLVAVGESWLEMLDPEQALALAEKALEADPESDDAGWLAARCLRQLGHPGAAAERLEEMCARHFQPRAEWLRAWGEAALEAGLRDKALQAARRLRTQAGDEALGPRLAELLGVPWQQGTLVHPEREGD